MAAIADHPPHHFTRFLSAADNSNFNYLLYSTVLISVLFPAYRFIAHDYQKFLDLGPGGTPSTFAGYLRVSCLRFFALKNPFVPPSITPTTLPQDSYLIRLPRRPGPRPTVAGIAPQRQTNQKGPPHLHAALSRALHNLAGAYPNLLRKGNSCFEKHGLALFLSTRQEHLAPTMAPHPGLSHINQTCADTAEICHLHAVDTSMHLTLHPHDAALVISSGWGERHPLAGRLIFGKRLLPSGFVMVYAPRTEEQVGVCMEIVKAGAWWVGGVRLGEGNDARGKAMGVVSRDRGI